MTTTLLTPGSCGYGYGYGCHTCLPPCNCSILKPGLGACQCLGSDYGPYLSKGDATITIVGSNINTPIDCTGRPVYPSSDPIIGATAPSAAGTYIIPCGTTACYYQTVPLGCTNIGGGVWYYVGGVQIIYRSGPVINGILVTLVHWTFIAYSPPTLYPTLTGPVDCNPWLLQEAYGRRISWNYLPTHLDWDYTPSVECRPICNSTRTRMGCISGVQTPEYDGPTENVGWSDDQAPFADYTVTLDIAAAS